MITLSLYCCACAANIDARLTDGREIYPHRADLFDLPFWRCDRCRNYVGCHHKTDERTKPLGCIPDAEMKKARSQIHAKLDPIWKEKRLDRKHLYARLTETLGRQYHTAELRTIEEARMIYRTLVAIDNEMRGVK